MTIFGKIDLIGMRIGILRPAFYLIVSISLLLMAVYMGLIEPSFPGHRYGLIDLYETAVYMAGSIGFALASRR